MNRKIEIGGLEIRIVDAFSIELVGLATALRRSGLELVGVEAGTKEAPRITVSLRRPPPPGTITKVDVDLRIEPYMAKHASLNAKIVLGGLEKFLFDQFGAELSRRREEIGLRATLAESESQQERVEADAAASSGAVPTVDELASLPRLAQVAFAARCARRTLPMYARQWAAAPVEHGAALEQAVDWAERFAATLNQSEPAPLGSITRAIVAAESAKASVVAVHAAKAIAQACAAAVAVSSGAGANSLVSRAAYEAITHVLAAADMADPVGPDGSISALIRREIHRDFVLVTRIAKEAAWVHLTPVPGNVFGQLWPEKQPVEVKVVNRKGRQRLVLKLAVPPMDDTEENRVELREQVRQLILAANEVHIAQGGSGLRVKDARAWIPSCVPYPAGGDE